MRVLEIDQLTKRFDGQDVLSDIHLTAASGEIVALKGPTASGKTTLLKIVAGMTTPTMGAVKVLDEAVIPGSRSNYQKMGIFLHEQGIYHRLTVRQYLTFFQRLFNVEHQRVDEIIRRAGLIDRQNDRIKGFSQSFTARVHMARAILHRPSLLLLDEPTAHLDLETMEVLRRLILLSAEEGAAVLLTTSSFEEAEALAQKVGKIERGKILSWKSMQEDSEAPRVGEAGLQRLRVEKVPAKVNDRIILFDPTELIYIDSQEGVSVLHTNGEEFQCPLTLAELEETLKGFGFFRSHRSYIVNLQRVREVIPWSRNSYSLVLDDQAKTTIPLSKGNLKELEGILGV